MYDFRSLSPLDFENLVRDLLQEEMGVLLESFGPGKDGGIDFRFAKAGASIVVQAKHYLDSRPDGLVRAARAENAKVAALLPTRYIFATSASMTPALKNRILRAMPNAPLAPGDVLGREDLNALLTRHGAVLHRHFKLWLASAAVLERILQSAVYNRTESELAAVTSLIPKFVHNDSVAEAERLLATKRALIIAGEPGVGKTTLARVLLWLHLEQGWRIFVVDDFKEAMEVASGGDKRLVFFDDFLGQIELTSDHIRAVDQRLPSLLDRLTNNKDLRFVLTTRGYLLNQAQIQSSRLASPRVTGSEFVLDVGAYTRTIRAQIVFNHIYFSDLAEEEKAALIANEFYLTIIDHRNFSPRLIELITSAEFHAIQAAPVRETVLRVLDNPSELWSTPYRSHLTEDARVLMRAVYFCGYYVELETVLSAFKRFARGAGLALPESEVLGRFRRALKALEGSIIQIHNGMLAFSNPGVRDFLARVIVDDRLIGSVVTSVDGFNELENAWAFYAKHREECRRFIGSEDIWSEALERIHNARRGSVTQRLRLALEIGEVIESTTLGAVCESILDSLEVNGVETNDVAACRRLLEQVHLVWNTELSERCIRLVPKAVADMLAEEGEYMDLDDIRSMVEALSKYSKDETSVRNAGQRALEGFVGNIDEKLSAIGSTSELDSFEDDLSDALLKHSVTLGYTTREELRRRRETLLEREEERGEGYQASRAARQSGDVSDKDIKSLFGTLSYSLDD
jgi:hypothetical protein